MRGRTVAGIIALLLLACIFCSRCALADEAIRKAERELLADPEIVKQLQKIESLREAAGAAERQLEAVKTRLLSTAGSADALEREFQQAWTDHNIAAQRLQEARKALVDSLSSEQRTAALRVGSQPERVPGATVPEKLRELTDATRELWEEEFGKTDYRTRIGTAGNDVELVVTNKGKGQALVISDGEVIDKWNLEGKLDADEATRISRDLKLGPRVQPGEQVMSVLRTAGLMLFVLEGARTALKMKDPETTLQIMDAFAKIIKEGNSGTAAAQLQEVLQKLSGGGFAGGQFTLLTAEEIQKALENLDDRARRRLAAQIHRAIEEQRKALRTKEALKRAGKSSSTSQESGKSPKDTSFPSTAVALPALGEGTSPKPLDGSWVYEGGWGTATIKQTSDGVKIDATYEHKDYYLVDAKIMQKKGDVWQLNGTWRFVSGSGCTTPGGTFYAEFDSSSTAIRVLPPTTDQCGWLRVVFTRAVAP